MQKSYKVQQKIHFEMTETHIKMKQMKDIMEKGADSGYGENTQDGFDVQTGGLKSGAQGDNQLDKGGVGGDKDADDLFSSDADSGMDDTSIKDDRLSRKMTMGKSSSLLRR